MRTPSAMRRNGAGRALLNYIIDVSRSRQYRMLYLETGCHPAFLPAQTLYRSAGFTVCDPFGPYRENGNSVFMSLPLQRPQRDPALRAVAEFQAKSVSGRSSP